MMHARSKHGLGLSSAIVALVLCASASTWAASDSFAGRLSVGSAEGYGVVSDSNGGAGIEGSEPRYCGAIGSTVWYTWTAPATTQEEFSLQYSTYDTVISVYTNGASFGALGYLGCNDDTYGLQSSVKINVTSGTTYAIQVGGYNGNQ